MAKNDWMYPLLCLLLVLPWLPCSEECSCSVPSSQREDCGYGGIGESECKSLGCCAEAKWFTWLRGYNCFYTSACNWSAPSNSRHNCGYSGITGAECRDLGCCYDDWWFSFWSECFYSNGTGGDVDAPRRRRSKPRNIRVYRDFHTPDGVCKCVGDEGKGGCGRGPRDFTVHCRFKSSDAPRCIYNGNPHECSDYNKNQRKFYQQLLDTIGKEQKTHTQTCSKQNFTTDICPDVKFQFQEEKQPSSRS